MNKVLKVGNKVEHPELGNGVITEVHKLWKQFKGGKQVVVNKIVYIVKFGEGKSNYAISHDSKRLKAVK